MPGAYADGYIFNIVGEPLRKSDYLDV